MLALASFASARTVVIPGAEAPGPARYDQVFVSKFGPANASRVLVLVPGTAGGAGDFTLLARDLVARVDDLQVWALDRRTQALEDTRVFRRVLRGRGSPDDAFDYYLRWIEDQSIEPHFEPLVDEPFMSRWGLKVALEDLRRVITAAGRREREVILGGHSLGASTALAYATWDFSGRPGHRDLAGLVLIDGGLLGTFDSFNLRQARRAVREIRFDPFLDLLGLGFPWVAGVFAEVGAAYALLDPTAASPVQQFALLPPEFKPGFPVTNRALLGYAFDADTSPEALELIHVRAGALAASGDPRDWENGEVTPIERVAQTFAQEPANGVEWYFPARLTIDVNGADALRRSPVARFLGLRTWHTRGVDVPLYAFQTSLTEGTVLRGARRFVRRSEVRADEAVLVDGSDSTSHLDPLVAAPESNEFLATLIPFLHASFAR